MDVEVPQKQVFAPQLYTSSDLFDVNLKRFCMRLQPEIDEGVEKNKASYQWYVHQSFDGFLYRLLKLSPAAKDGSKAERLNLYTRENYTTFSRFMTFIHNELPHLLLVIPQ
jgi:hypothetical protein